MARAEKGTTRKLRIWLERQTTIEGDEIVFAQIVGGEANVLSRWTIAQASTPDWEELVFGLAQENANERGTTTLYQVRMVRDDKCRSVYELKCRAEGERDASEFDGSSNSLVQGLYGQNETLLKHILSSQNAAYGPLTKALEFANERMRAVEGERARLADENYKLNAKIALLEAKLAEVDDEQMDKIGERLQQLFVMAKSSGFFPKDA